MFSYPHVKMHSKWEELELGQHGKHLESQRLETQAQAGALQNEFKANLPCSETLFHSKYIHKETDGQKGIQYIPFPHMTDCYDHN